MKNMLCEHSGSDPLMLKVRDELGEVKILSASMFWVNSTNSLVDRLKQNFHDRIDVKIKSLDSNLAEVEA